MVKPDSILPLDVAFDSHNDLYICDSGSNRIRKVDRETGIITTVVGTGQHGFNGDGPALEVNLTWPAAIAFDADDVMYIADTQAHRIRRYDLTNRPGRDHRGKLDGRRRGPRAAAGCAKPGRPVRRRHRH